MPSTVLVAGYVGVNRRCGQSEIRDSGMAVTVDMTGRGRPGAQS